MKNNFTILFLLISSIGYSQIVTLTPAIVTQNDTVTITFDATQGNAGLVGISPVYMHTGVITNLSSGPTNWRHVQGNWGTADPKVLMTSIGNNKHTLKYHINSFYSVPTNETVSALAFVFRNVDGSKEGKTASNGDIFVPISTGGYTGGFTSHILDQYIIIKGDTANLMTNVSDSSDIKIRLNGNIVAQDSNALSLNYIFLTANYATGYYTFVMEANNDTATIYDTVNFLNRGGTPIASLPPYGEEGIHAINDSTMYFQLRAPFKDFIYLIGDFNDWKFLPEYELNKTPAGDYFWIEITGLDKTKEYGFQYMIDEEQMLIADPYVEKVLDPWNDPYIPSSVYPNLKPYPSGKTSQIVGVFQIEETAYNWANNNFAKPPIEELIVYELLVRDFDQDHDYNAVIGKLDYIKDMGANAIHLMPVMEFEGNESWGYNPSFMFAPDKYYGPKNELKRLVDSCHSLGIAVILDIVLNHNFGQSPLLRMYFDPSAGQWGQPTAQSPWFNEIPKHDFNVGYDFNHESPDTKHFAKEVFKHWVEEYKIDGYRLDLSKGYTQKNTLGNVGAWGQYDQKRINTLNDYANTIWSVDSNAYYILEHFADNNEETVLSANGHIIWGNANHEYNEAAMGYTSNFDWVSSKTRGWADMHLLGYMESHDEERLMYKTLNFGNSNSNYNTRVLDTALQRMALVSAFFYTIPGPKMLWQFGELGYDYSINYCPNGSIDPSCRVANKPIKWDYLNEPNRRELYAITSELIHLRETHPVFSYDKNHDLSVSGFNKRIKLSDANLQVVVIGNFGIAQSSINPKFHQTGWWYNHFTRDSINVTDVNATISLEPGEWRIYTSKSLETAIGIEENTSSAFSEINIYPNPFEAGITIKSKTGEAIESVVVLDYLGRTVWRKDGKQTSVFWDGNDRNGASVAAGLYIIRVSVNGKVHSGKVVKR